MAYTMIKMLPIICLALCVVGLDAMRDPDITFEQAEGQTAGSFVGSVASSRKILDMVGESDRAELQYSKLSEGSQYLHSEYIQIDRVSGNITFGQFVDRETICPFLDDCYISFGVAVSGGSNNFFTLEVKVVISDINDNSPRFSETATTIYIAESANPSDFSRPLVTATDADRSDQFSITDYNIIPESREFDVEFSRNQLGTPQVNLLLKQKLDREVKEVYSITLEARDGGTPPRTGTLLVNIYVEDINDNEPKFSQTFYTANFSENTGAGYSIIRVFASDDDIGDNGKVAYSLSNTPNSNIDVSDKILVNASSGEVVLTHSLTSGLYNILIDAHDNGIPPKSNQAVIKVNVLDTSNNKPEVTVNQVQLGDLPLGSVSESEQSSTVVAVLNVADPDSGRNGNVTCETSDAFFQLQQLQPFSFKLMVARPLNREVNATHKVNVTCRDQGTPSLNDTVTVTIRVADENDNNPEFTKPVYEQTIIENNIDGDTITVVNAFDIDDGDNAEIEYRLEDGEDDFLITPDSGLIKAARVFNREDRARYEFKILAVDHGTPERTGTATMIVNIRDVNDVAPIFTKENYTFYLYENRDAHSMVGNVSVSDPDEGQGGVVTLSLVPLHKDDAVPFEIDNQGRVSSLYMFDREVRDSYSFYVLGKDGGQRSLSSMAHVVVNILDVNDNRPMFIFPTDQNDSAFVNIPIASDQVISQVEVFDRDVNNNGIITYHIISSNSSDVFRIGKFSGEIISNKDLGPGDLGTFSISINATDQGFPVMSRVRTLKIIVQSESAKKGEVIANKNVLIVACIVCFTIIVSGAVLVAMCVLRRLDRQRKQQYAATSCPDTRPDSDSGSMEDRHQQYDLSTTSKADPSRHHPEKDSAYHQQVGHPHFLHGSSTNTGSTTKYGDISTSSSNISGGKSSRGGGSLQRQGYSRSRGDNSSLQSEPPPFYLVGPNAKMPEAGNTHRHDDFQSTSSTETATGDSGHGSDEDLSSSMDQTHSLTVSLEPGTNAASHNHQQPIKSYRKASDSSLNQSKLMQPSISRPPTGKPHVRGKGNSVRFDPRVTDIYDDKNEMAEFHAKPWFTGSNSSLRDSSMSQVYPLSQNNAQHFKNSAQQPLRQTLPFSSNSSSNPRDASKSRLIHPHTQPQFTQVQAPKALHTFPQQRLAPSPLSFSSNFNDDANDDSDLNTTTSGSYSVASDDVARESSLMMSNDMFV